MRYADLQQHPPELKWVLEVIEKKSWPTVLSIRAGSQPKQPAAGQSLAGYFLLTLLLILVRNLN